MAIQAQMMYSDNLGFPLGGGGGGTHDLLFVTDHLQNDKRNHNNGIAPIGFGGGGGGGGGRGLINFQRQQQQQKLQAPPPAAAPQMQFFRNHPQDNTFFPLPPCHPPPSSNMNMGSSQMESHQKLEIDLLITLQYERLRWALQEQRKQQVATLIKSYESKARYALQQKDEEIAKGLNRMMELEQLLKGIEAENQTWERVAREKEVIIANMNNAIEQLQLQIQNANNNGATNVVVEDAESCCCENTEAAPPPAGGASAAAEGGNGICKICKTRESCVILLPCRHLCCCNACVAFIGACPMCNMVKKATIEALF